MAYTNSSLVNYKKISPNKTSPRNHIIDTITIHCMAGNLTIERCGDLFANSSRQASSNYGIGSDGRVALYVEEKDRSWCSSNSANDHRAVTIEVANDGGAPEWHVSDRAMKSLIELVADICKRNNIKELKWRGNKSLIGQISKQNMTVHRWFSAKSCPGDYLYNKHYYIASEVNKKLGAPGTVASNDIYRVRKKWEDVSSQIGAFSSFENARNACQEGYSVFDNNGNIVYSKLDSTHTQIPNTDTKLKIETSIKAIQTWLNVNYNTKIVEDNIYGTNTKKAIIKALQTEIGGLVIDGIWGTKSRNAAPTIYSGSNGIIVTIWQAYLVCRGYNPNGIDGIFGSKCVSATKMFQGDNTITKDGIVGKNTWNKAFL